VPLLVIIVVSYGFMYTAEGFNFRHKNRVYELLRNLRMAVPLDYSTQKVWNQTDYVRNVHDLCFHDVNDKVCD